MTHPLKNVACPQCGKKGTWSAENTFRPFCSERCKLMDLGAWADEKRRVPGDPADPEKINDEE